jgi:hypothetical protein
MKVRARIAAFYRLVGSEVSLLPVGNFKKVIFLAHA